MVADACPSAGVALARCGGVSRTYCIAQRHVAKYLEETWYVLSKPMVRFSDLFFFFPRSSLAASPVSRGGAGYWASVTSWGKLWSPEVFLL